MKEFEIWSEGYGATGGESDATFLGNAMGNTFDEACENFRQPEDVPRQWTMRGEDPILIKKGTPLNLDKNSDGTYRRGSYRGESAPGVNRANLKGNYSIWACQLFDNEADARKSFG